MRTPQALQPRREVVAAPLLLLPLLLGVGPCEAGLATRGRTQGVWRYGNQTLWSSIPGAMCSHVGDQSPINIETFATVSGGSFPIEVSESGRSARVGPVTWSYQWPMVNVSLGWTDRKSWGVRILPPYDASTVVRFFGKDFALRSVRFTSPSENQIEGVGSDMEVQHVHEGSDGQLLVVAVLLRVGLVPDNAYLAQFWDAFPPYHGKEVQRIVTNPFYGAFPSDRSFFAFNGSLTHPPCKNETVWVVFREPVLISREQRNRYRLSINATSSTFFRYAAAGQSSPSGVVEPWDASIGMNNRFVQPQGGRKVVSFQMEPTSTAALESAGAPPGLIGTAAISAPSGGLSGLIAAIGDSWAYVVLGILAAILLVGVVALAVVARQHGRLRRKATRGRPERDELLESERRKRGSRRLQQPQEQSRLEKVAPEGPRPLPSPSQQPLLAPCPPQEVSRAVSQPVGRPPVVETGVAQPQAQQVPFRVAASLQAPPATQPVPLMGATQGAPLYQSQPGLAGPRPVPGQPPYTARR